MDELFLRTDNREGIILEPGMSYAVEDQMFVLHVGTKKVTLYPVPVNWLLDLGKCLDNLIKALELK